MIKRVLMLAAAFGLFFVFAGCEKDEEDFGTVVVINETGFSIITDVRWGEMEENDLRVINDGDQTTYESIPAGDISLWGQIDEEGFGWASYDATLEPDQTLNFTWNPPAD